MSYPAIITGLEIYVLFTNLPSTFGRKGCIIPKNICIGDCYHCSTIENVVRFKLLPFVQPVVMGSKLVMTNM